MENRQDFIDFVVNGFEEYRKDIKKLNTEERGSLKIWLAGKHGRYVFYFRAENSYVSIKVGDHEGRFLFIAHIGETDILGHLELFANELVNRYVGVLDAQIKVLKKLRKSLT